MKFSPEFQPGQFLGFGFTLIFLLFFCTFCARADPSSYEDWFDSDEYTTRQPRTWSTPSRTTPRTTGTGTRTGTKKTVPDSHEIGITGEYRFQRKIECRGADVSNLTVMQCDGSILKCQNKLPCFINKTSCTTHDEISSGDNCVTRQSSGYYFSHYHSHSLSGYDRSGSGTGTEKCLKVPVTWTSLQSGIIKCISSLSSWSSAFPPKPKVTIDYFYTGVDAKTHLLSSHKPPNSTMIKLGISYSGQELVLRREGEEIEPEVVYTSEQLVIACTAVTFFIDLKSIKVEARTKNGTEYQIDAALYFKLSPNSITGYWQKGIQRFRVPKDVDSFSCVGRRLDNSEIVRTTTNIVVIDPPSQLLVKSPNGSDFQVDSKIGCNLSPSHTKSESQSIKRKLFNLLDISQHSEFWITSPIYFLRFQIITKGNFSCTKLQLDGNSNSKSNSNSNDRFDYYFDLDVKKPRIEKPAGDVSTVNLKVQNLRSLVCEYTGNPMPYVIWLQNGKEIFYTVGTEISTGQSDFEKSVLHLPIENLNNSTEISSDSTDSNLKYSCVVRNHLGVDRLDFVIESDKNSASASASQTNSKPEDKSNGLIYGLISCLFILVLVGLGFYFIRGKKETKRAVLKKSRGDENTEHCENVGEILDVNSRNLGNPSQNYTEIPSNGVSHGILIPNKFHSGDAKYKMLS